MKVKDFEAEISAKSAKMTLKDYYKSLPERTSPKLEFLENIAKGCGVTVTSARNWCLYGMKPKSYKSIKVLEELTGIQEEDLWTD